MHQKYIHILSGILLPLLILVAYNTQAQAPKKVDFIGAARTYIGNNQLVVQDSLPDTTTVKRNAGGYSLIDLGVNITPNKNTEIMGMIRIRNAYGGFWGAGVTFDVRQIWVKGVIANAVRYQIGDLNLKQTPFTLYNHNEDRLLAQPDVFGLQSDIVDYERFYQKNTWRQQGASMDFGLNFAKYLKEITFNGFVTRMNMTNFLDVPERLFGGGNVQLLQSKHLRAAYHYTNLFDVVGTISDSNALRNRVQSGTVVYNHDIKKWNLKGAVEVGNSRASFTRDTAAPDLKDFFIHADITASWDQKKSFIKVGYLNVGPDFRSAGAQSKRVNYEALPDFFNRYGNSQQVRAISMLDVMRNENIYNTSISNGIMSYNPIFNNVTPFGLATFNRKGFYGQVQYTLPKEWGTVNVENYSLAEIRGQGTTKRKTYQLNKADVTLHIHKMAKMQRILKLNGGIAMQNTLRNSELDFEKIKLNSLQYTAGITFEVVKQLDILGGAMWLNAAGNEYSADRNKYGEVIDFNTYKIDTEQNLYATGLRFRFNDKIHLSGFYQLFQYKNKLVAHQDYATHQVLVIYNMTF